MAVQLPNTTGEPDESRCLFCKEKVPRDFRRVFGDHHDRAHRCRACDTLTRIKEGSAAGLEVANADPVNDVQKQHYVTATNPVLADGGQEADQ